MPHRGIICPCRQATRTRVKRKHRKVKENRCVRGDVGEGGGEVGSGGGAEERE